MYGRYTKDLGEYAKNEARKLKMLERRRKQEDKARDRVSAENKKQFEFVTEQNIVSLINVRAYHFTGIVWQAFESYCTSVALDLEKFICSTGWGLGVFGFVRNHYGTVVLHYG